MYLRGAIDGGDDLICESSKESFPEVTAGAMERSFGGSVDWVPLISPKGGGVSSGVGSRLDVDP